MPRNKDHEFSAPLGYDDSIQPTDDKLKADAGSLAAQYLRYWLPGEVEITVILSRPESLNVAYATSIMRRERLKHTLEQVKQESAIQSLLVRGTRPQR